MELRSLLRNERGKKLNPRKKNKIKNFKKKKKLFSATFLDHYLDVPLDLSRVLFVCTANVLEAIPGPLLDRMEVIRIPGYYGKEKEAIARGYLEPAARADAGVPSGAVALDDGALRRLIDEYCSEAGVRNLKKQIEKVYRKAALRLVEAGSVVLPPSGGGGGGDGGAKKEEKEGEASAALSTATAATLVEGTPAIRVTPETLPDFVGQPPFSQDKLYSAAEGRPPPPGVATGLAWTAGGGSTLHVEAAVASRRRSSGGGKGGGGEASASGGGKGGLSSTGQLGEVMRESTTIAHTVARAVYAKLVKEGRKRGKRKGDEKGGGEEEEEEDEEFSKNDNNSFTFGAAARALAPAAASDPTFFADASIHVHVPAGATPKDGPSAGVTLVTALLSLALGRASDPHLAMTGEVRREVFFFSFFFLPRSRGRKNVKKEKKTHSFFVQSSFFFNSIFFLSSLENPQTKKNAQKTLLGLAHGPGAPRRRRERKGPGRAQGRRRPRGPPRGQPPGLGRARRGREGRGRRELPRGLRERVRGGVWSGGGGGEEVRPKERERERARARCCKKRRHGEPRNQIFNGLFFLSPTFELNLFSRSEQEAVLSCSILICRALDMSAACSLTSSALAGRAAPTRRAATCAGINGGGGLLPVAVAANGTIRRPFPASTSPLSPLRPHQRCRVFIGRALVETKADFVARASVESHGEEEEETSSSPPNFSVKTFFDPTAGLTTAQLAALASAALEADAAGLSRRQIKVAALAKRTGLDRSEVLQWLRSVDELMPPSVSSAAASSGGGGGDGDGGSDRASAARAQRESTLGAYAAAGAAAAARAKASSAARQEERQRRREAADLKRSGGKKLNGDDEGGNDADDGTWSTKKGLGSRGGARLSKAAEATLDRVYARSPFPTDEVVAGVRELHRELPKKVVLDYFAERRRGDGGGRGGGGGSRGKGSSDSAAAGGGGSSPSARGASSRARAPARD